jgi:hypothetical protein
MTLDATEQGTRFVRAVDVDPKPAYKLFWWIAWPFMRRRSEAGNLRFKQLLESGETEPGGSIDPT